MHVTYVKYIDLISLNILHKNFNIFILPPSSIDIIVLFLYTVFIELHLSLRAFVCVSVCGSRVNALAPSFDVDASPRGRCC